MLCSPCLRAHPRLFISRALHTTPVIAQNATPTHTTSSTNTPTRHQRVPRHQYLLYRKISPVTTPTPTSTSTITIPTPQTRTGPPVPQTALKQAEAQLAKLAALQAAAPADGSFTIEQPRVYPPPAPRTSGGARQRRRVKRRLLQRLRAHKRTIHTRPATNAAKVNPRHLSLPPTDVLPKFPPVVIPRLPQIEYDKLAMLKEARKNAPTPTEPTTGKSKQLRKEKVKLTKQAKAASS